MISVTYITLCVYYANCRFEDDESFHYLKIPVKDHWSQNLISYLPSAISFIGTRFYIYFFVFFKFIYVYFCAQRLNKNRRQCVASAAAAASAAVTAAVASAA